MSNVQDFTAFGFFLLRKDHLGVMPLTWLCACFFATAPDSCPILGGDLCGHSSGLAIRAHTRDQRKAAMESYVHSVWGSLLSNSAQCFRDMRSLEPLGNSFHNKDVSEASWPVPGTLPPSPHLLMVFFFFFNGCRQLFHVCWSKDGK